MSIRRLFSVAAACGGILAAASSTQAVSVTADYRADFQGPAPSAGWASVMPAQMKADIMRKQAEPASDL